MHDSKISGLTLSDIWDDQGDLKIDEIALSVAQISISEFDQGSRKICSYCVELAKNASEFRDLCINSNKHLKITTNKLSDESADLVSDVKLEVFAAELEVIDPLQKPSTKLDAAPKRYSLRKNRNVPKKFETSFVSVECIPDQSKMESSDSDYEDDEEKVVTEVEIVKGFDQDYIKSFAEICGISLKDLNTMCENYKSKETAKKFKCMLCIKNFPTNYKLLRHQQQSHTESVSLSSILTLKKRFY